MTNCSWLRHTLKDIYSWLEKYSRILNFFHLFRNNPSHLWDIMTKHKIQHDCERNKIQDFQMSTETSEIYLYLAPFTLITQKKTQFNRLPLEVSSWLSARFLVKHSEDSQDRRGTLKKVCPIMFSKKLTSFLKKNFIHMSYKLGNFRIGKLWIILSGRRFWSGMSIHQLEHLLYVGQLSESFHQVCLWNLIETM